MYNRITNIKTAARQGMALSRKGRKCYPCLRNEVSPFSREGQPLVSQRLIGGFVVTRGGLCGGEWWGLCKRCANRAVPLEFPNRFFKAVKVDVECAPVFGRREGAADARSRGHRASISVRRRDVGPGCCRSWRRDPRLAQAGSCRCHVHTCSGVTTLDGGSTAGSCYTRRFLLS